MDEWVVDGGREEGRVDGWRDRWEGGWVGGWVDGCLYEEVGFYLLKPLSGVRQERRGRNGC